MVTLEQAVNAFNNVRDEEFLAEFLSELTPEQIEAWRTPDCQNFVRGLRTLSPVELMIFLETIGGE